MENVVATKQPLAGILVEAVGYSRMFQTMATVALAMAVAFAVASKGPDAHRVALRQ